jgi:cytochrome b pre-mRNA-processing protein 3
MLGLFRKPESAPRVRLLYDVIVARARTPSFHTGLGVPDTMDGRFDVLTLHVFLVMDTLKQGDAAAHEFSARLVTLVFAGFEEALRDLGVGDVGLSRRIKAMANAFYGRLEAYGAAANNPEPLADAVLRNLYRGDAARALEAAHFAAYMEQAARRLTAPALCLGNADFGPLPECDPS